MTKADLTAQKKQTAIRNILKGQNFSREKFKEFWDDKECFRLGVIKNPYIIGYDDSASRFKKWWQTWRWEEDFVQDLLIEVLKKHGDFTYRMFPSGILEHLPLSVTNDIEVAKLLAKHGVHEYENYLGPEIKEKVHTTLLAEPNNTLFLRWIHGINFWTQFGCEKTAAWLMYETDPDLALHDIEHGPNDRCIVPIPLVRGSKRLSAAYIRKRIYAAFVPNSYFDDIDFVFDCLGPNPGEELFETVVNRLSYRIRKFIGINEPLQALKVLQNLNWLSDITENNHVDSSTKPNSKVNKI